jgi:hypothetical protein
VPRANARSAADRQAPHRGIVFPKESEFSATGGFIATAGVANLRDDDIPLRRALSLHGS